MLEYTQLNYICPMKKIIEFGSNTLTCIIAVIPVFASCAPCPTCMPVYAAIFSFFGFQLADYSTYLMPAMLLSMVISIAMMFHQAQKRGLSHAPMLMTIATCSMLFISKFMVNSVWLTYVCMLGMITASFMHRRNAKQTPCGQCSHS